MVELRDSCDPLSEVEALVLQAGDYVRASDDLRPRVLEIARAQRSECRTQRWLWQAAFSMVLVAILIAPRGQHQDANAARQPGSTLEGCAIDEPEEAAAGSGDATWELVESFTRLRQRHAAMLRLAL